MPNVTERKLACRCGNCEWTGDLSQLHQPIADLEERLGPNPNVLLPEGECPECGALAYTVEDYERSIRDDRKLAMFDDLVLALEGITKRLELECAATKAVFPGRALVPDLLTTLRKAKAIQ